MEEGTWHAAQTVIDQHALWADRNVRREYLLRGLIHCGECGFRYVGTGYVTGERTHTYYTCNGKTPARGACPSKAVPGFIDELVWAEITRILTDPGAFLREAADRVTTSTEPDRLPQVEQQLQGVDQERSRVLSLYQRGHLDDSECDAKLREISTRREKLSIEVRRLQSTASVDVDSALSAAARALELLRSKLPDGYSFAARREVAETLVERLDTEGGRVVAAYHLPAGCEPQGHPCNPLPSVRRSYTHSGTGWSSEWRDGDGVILRTVPRRVKA